MNDNLKIQTYFLLKVIKNKSFKNIKNVFILIESKILQF